MGRISKIDKLGLGAEILGYALADMRHDEIIERIHREHPEAKLSFYHITRYLQAHTSKSLAGPTHNASCETDSATEYRAIKEFSLATFRRAFLEAINEAKAKYEVFQDDPRAGWAWFKHYIDILDRMGRAVGGYEPDKIVALQTRESMEAALEARGEVGSDRIAAILDILSDVGAIELPATIDGRRCGTCPYGPKPIDERIKEYANHFEKVLGAGQDPQAQPTTGENTS